MKSVADSTGAFITILNSDRQIVFANNAIVEAFDTDLEHALGLRPGELMSCENADTNPGGCGTSKFCSTCGAANAIRASRTGGAQEEECRIIRENGDPIDLRVTATPFVLDEEQFTLFTAVDIGDAKRRRALERIFFHDIMNTATGVRGLSSMARIVDDTEREEMLGLLETASEHMIDEIEARRQLLAAETNDLVAQPQRIQSRDLLVDAASFYESHDVGTGKSVVIDATSEDVAFESDPTLLGRVIGNLVKNALEATEEGGTVTLDCSHTGSRVEFSVHNNGLIPHEAQLQIFQRSFITKGAGRGLGTFGARMLTERYLDGDIGFESNEDVGTTFTVSYPFIIPVDDGRP